MPNPSAIGFVDGIFDGDVIGWIYNGDTQNAGLEQILVSTDLGYWTSFGAHVPRQDIAKAIGRPGVYGFAIPTLLLPRFRERVFFRYMDGTLLQNGEVAPPHIQVSAIDNRSRYLMLHIPKTAGTSLRNFLVESYQESRICSIYNDDNDNIYIDYARFLSLSMAQRAHFKLFIGHLFSTVSQQLPFPHRLLTFLRDPMERVKSNVWHRLRSGPFIITPTGEIPIKDAVNEAKLDEFDNCQIRMIGGIIKETTPRIGRYHVQFAMQSIYERFDFVGRVEDMETDMAALARLLGISPRPLPRENVKLEPDARAQEIFDSIDWARVEERHAADRELYDWVKKNGNWLNERYKGAALLRAHNSSL
jgi:hypothetical protein